jgi:hypothetical protein
MTIATPRMTSTYINLWGTSEGWASVRSMVALMRSFIVVKMLYQAALPVLFFIWAVTPGQRDRKIIAADAQVEGVVLSFST